MFEGVQVGCEVAGGEGFVVLAGDAVLGEFFEDEVEVGVGCVGAVVGPGGVDAELDVIAGECFGFDGLALPAPDSVAGEELGKLAGGWFLVVVDQVGVPGVVVAVDLGELVVGGIRGGVAVVCG